MINKPEISNRIRRVKILFPYLLTAGILFTLTVLWSFCQSSASESPMVRLARIMVKEEYVTQYKTFLREEIVQSLKLEPGVLRLHAVSDKKNPSLFFITEIYADSAAYLSHIKSAHFTKYKQGTLAMVDSLTLYDTEPLIKENYEK